MTIPEMYAYVGGIKPRLVIYENVDVMGKFALIPAKKPDAFIPLLIEKDIFFTEEDALKHWEEGLQTEKRRLQARINRIDAVLTTMYNA